MGAHPRAACAVLFGALFAAASACLCAQPVDALTFFYSELRAGRPFSRVVVDAVSPNLADGMLNYTLWVTAVIGGCPAGRLPRVVFASASNISSCTAPIRVKGTYILPVPLTSSNFEIGQCSGIVSAAGAEVDGLFVSFTPAFLGSRQVCCRPTLPRPWARLFSLLWPGWRALRICSCPEGQSTRCLSNPCRTASPPCQDAKRCRANPCAKCAPEWFTDAGLPACRPSYPRIAS